MNHRYIDEAASEAEEASLKESQGRQTLEHSKKVRKHNGEHGQGEH